jgi:hypothetical protein
MIEGKGLGGKKVNRVGLSLSNRDNAKLNKLATACNMKPTPLAALILTEALNDPKYVDQLQKRFCTQAAYRVMLVKDYKNDDYNYVLSGREDLK